VSWTTCRRNRRMCARGVSLRESLRGGANGPKVTCAMPAMTADGLNGTSNWHNLTVLPRTACSLRANVALNSARPSIGRSMRGRDDPEPIPNRAFAAPHSKPTSTNSRRREFSDSWQFGVGTWTQPIVSRSRRSTVQPTLESARLSARECLQSTEALFGVTRDGNASSDTLCY